MLQCRSKIGVRASTLVYLQADELTGVRALTPVHKQAAR